MPGKTKINTMEELSGMIGVSRPTLSRYFQDPTSVRVSTREKIRVGLEQVEYVPNFFATRMNRKASRLIGVIVPDLNDLFFTSLLNVIEKAARQAGYTTIIQSSHGDPAIEASAVETLLSMQADGAIVGPLGEHSDSGVLSRLSQSLPIVLVDSRMSKTLPQIDFVGTDNRQSIKLITEYLCRIGAPPVFLGMPRLNSNSIERERAYVATLESLGHRPRFIRSESQPENWDFESYAFHILNESFSRGDFVSDTILCANDRLAIGALRAANLHGLFARVPGRTDSIRIAGHDDHSLSRFMTPTLTTVAQDIDAIGRCAVSVLIDRILRPDAIRDAGEIKTFDAVLKIRESA